MNLLLCACFHHINEEGGGEHNPEQPLAWPVQGSDVG